MLKHGLIKDIEDIYYDDKSEDDKKIAAFLLENFKNKKVLNISVIAEKCNVSPTKVTRFSDKLGLKGFKELKLRLNDIAKSVIIDGELVDVNDNVVQKKEVFFDNYNVILVRSQKRQFEYLKSIQMAPIIKNLLRAKNVYLFAFNLSYNVSKNFVQRLKWSGINIISESDIISIDTYLNLITQEDIVVLITISGKNNFIKEITEKIDMKTKLYCIGGEICNFKERFDYYFDIKAEEDLLWNINSIRAQMVIQILDFIHINLLIESNLI
ncbi:MurR/RpiR family transcriptional regulator [Spiroplasma chinense]|uniref:MurR/RpiR family transcriptional regulator n=1 Tax=Spiroplasma chinense TaxID=216932 RepID=A0A5B9Y5D4_9MOLU|nr:MurR/RpiR family transcriptional regulator [Spiroplasma chinense]QEH61467.1 MurR/RpiR family transcriptional regulator [Spiroplasma chinense]